MLLLSKVLAKLQFKIIDPFEAACAQLLLSKATLSCFIRSFWARLLLPPRPKGSIRNSPPQPCRSRNMARHTRYSGQSYWGSPGGWRVTDLLREIRGKAYYHHRSNSEGNFPEATVLDIRDEDWGHIIKRGLAWKEFVDCIKRETCVNIGPFLLSQDYLQESALELLFEINHVTKLYIDTSRLCDDDDDQYGTSNYAGYWDAEPRRKNTYQYSQSEIHPIFDGLLALLANTCEDRHCSATRSNAFSTQSLIPLENLTVSLRTIHLTFQYGITANISGWMVENFIEIKLFECTFEDRGASFCQSLLDVKTCFAYRISLDHTNMDLTLLASALCEAGTIEALQISMDPEQQCWDFDDASCCDGSTSTSTTSAPSNSPHLSWTELCSAVGECKFTKTVSFGEGCCWTSNDWSDGLVSLLQGPSVQEIICFVKPSDESRMVCTCERAHGMPSCDVLSGDISCGDVDVDERQCPNYENTLAIVTALHANQQVIKLSVDAPNAPICRKEWRDQVLPTVGFHEYLRAQRLIKSMHKSKHLTNAILGGVLYYMVKKERPLQLFALICETRGELVELWESKKTKLNKKRARKSKSAGSWHQGFLCGPSKKDDMDCGRNEVMHYGSRSESRDMGTTFRSNDDVLYRLNNLPTGEYWPEFEDDSMNGMYG